MSIFGKKTRTHFERDEAGRVTGMTRTGDVSRTPVYDSLKPQTGSKMKENIKAAYKESVKKKKERKKVYRDAYDVAAKKELQYKAKRKAKARYHDGGNILSGLESGFSSQPTRSSRSYPQTRKKKSSKRKTTRKKKSTSSSIDDLFHAGDNFF